MQHLLDFIQEHILEDQLYLALPSESGWIELTWRRSVGDDDVWHVRGAGHDAETEIVHFGDLLDHLEMRGANMTALESELQAIAVTQVTVADIVLREARQVLGHDVVRRAVSAPRYSPPPAARGPKHDSSHLSVVAGTGERTEARTGHLKLVR